MGLDLSFFYGKKVLVTGHTGFKGTWLTKMLVNAGADVIGYSRCSQKDPSLFALSEVEKQINHIKGDVRDLEHLKTNVMGTVNIMECARLNSCVMSILNITTDKVYRNNEWCWGYREDEPLDGFDPYSNSKSCSELVTNCYKNSFFADKSVAVSTVRAGNVIGGGDFAENRIIPDCIRSAQRKENIMVRNPNSIRPYQHVLEPLFAYLLIAEKQYEDAKYSGNYNVGPEYKDCITTGTLAKIFCEKWGENIKWYSKNNNGPHEANFLKLDCSKIKATFGWTPHWNVEQAIEKIK